MKFPVEIGTLIYKSLNRAETRERKGTGLNRKWIQRGWGSAARLLVALACLLALLCGAARTGSIQVTLAAGNKVLANADVTVYRVADRSGTLARDFAAASVTAEQFRTEKEHKDAAKVLAAFAEERSVSGTTAATDSKGVALFSGLTEGIYLVTGGTEFDPFLAVLPMTADGKENYNILAEPKIDEPDEPDNPDNPDEPDEPDNPDTPDEPDEPDNPDTPDEPDEPDNPPDTPDEPNSPDNPDTPDSPDEPGQPANPDTPKTSDPSQAALWAGLVLCSGAVLAALWRTREKK